MNLESHELAGLMVAVANERFGSRQFPRRTLMDATEEEVRKQGFWTPADDILSGSRGTKSRGLAAIDYRFSDLARWGTLVRDRPNVWRLATPKPLTPKETQQTPVDLSEPPPRYDAHVSRIIRDTKLARELKSLYGFACQVCGLRIEPSRGSFYVEVHHVRPLGGGHDGLDTQGNMLVLCPNHHAMFDFGIPRFLSPLRVEIAGTSHDLTLKHALSQESIAYHNTKLQSSNA
jgi:hypothetical protein